MAHVNVNINVNVNVNVVRDQSAHELLSRIQGINFPTMRTEVNRNTLNKILNAHGLFSAFFWVLEAVH